MDQKTLQNQLKNCKVREGPLYKRSRFLKEWRERWIVLTMNYLFTFTNKLCKEVTEIIELKEIKSYKSYLRKDQEMIPAGFKVRSDDQEFYFCGRNATEKWSWIVTLQRLMDYKYVGSSTYNNIQFIKSRGFNSQLEFENGGKLDKISEPEKVKIQAKKVEEETKKQVDKEVEKILKQLQNQKLQLKQKQLEFVERQNLLKQQQISFKKQQSDKIQQLQKKIQQLTHQLPQKAPETEGKIINSQIELPKEQAKNCQLEVVAQKEQIKNQQKKNQQTVQQSHQKSLKTEKPTENNYLEESDGTKLIQTPEPPTFLALKNHFEKKMAESKQAESASKLKTDNLPKNSTKKSNKEKLKSLRSKTVSNLFQQFYDQDSQSQILKFTLDFLARMASNPQYGYYSSIISQVKSHKNAKFLANIFLQILTDYKDLENCEVWAKFIEIFMIYSPQLFNENQAKIMKNKLVDFVLGIEDQSKLELILENVFTVSKISEFQKNEGLKQKLVRLSNEAKKQETKKWARQLLDRL